MCVLQEPQDAGDPDGAAGCSGVGLGLGAVGVGDPPEIVLRGCRGGDLASVVGLHSAARGVVIEQEPAAPDAGGLRLHQAQHRLRGDERIGRGSAVTEHFAGRLRGQWVGGDDRVAGRVHGRHVFAVASGDLGVGGDVT